MSDQDNSQPPTSSNAATAESATKDVELKIDESLKRKYPGILRGDISMSEFYRERRGNQRFYDSADYQMAKLNYPTSDSKGDETPEAVSARPHAYKTKLQKLPEQLK